MADTWQIFGATNTRANRKTLKLRRLPPPPPWRAFSAKTAPVAPDVFAMSAKDEEVERGADFVCTAPLAEAVNAALYLRRPLLLTGKPGAGKSTLIYAVARELMLGPVLRWSITSRSTLRDGLYLYDSLGRLNERSARRSSRSDDIGDYIELGPLGTALYPTNWPRALLIDEIDKSDLDLPNDLLNVFEEGEVNIPELTRHRKKTVDVRLWRRDERVTVTKGKFTCKQFPFVVLTSNGERTFPAPFLRRCIQFTIPDPTPDQLRDIVVNRLRAVDPQGEKIIADYLERRKSGDVATDQLLNAIFLTAGKDWTFETDPSPRLRDLLMAQLAQNDPK